MSASAGTLIAAVLLPPLGAYLSRGLRSEFWIATGLTVLGFVPGVIYALYLAISDRAGPLERSPA